MKNDAARWMKNQTVTCHGNFPNNNKIYNTKNNHFNITAISENTTDDFSESTNVRFCSAASVVSVSEVLSTKPAAPHRIHERTTQSQTQKQTRIQKYDCDKLEEIYSKNYPLLKHAFIASPSSYGRDRATGRNVNVAACEKQNASVEVSISDAVPATTAVANYYKSHATNKYSRSLRHSSSSVSTSSSFRRLGYRSDLIQFLLIFSQVVCVLLLCNFNVGVVSGTSDSSSSVGRSEAKVDPLMYPHQPTDAVDESNNGHYTHTWAVHIPNGDNGLADEVARDHGFINLGKIFDDHYHFAHHKVSKRSLSPAIAHQTRLDEDERVHWAKQQVAKSRSKRDYIRMRPSRTSSRAQSLVDTVPFSDPKWAQMWYLNRGGGLDMNVVPAWKEGVTGKGIVVTILDDGLESDHPDIEHNYDPKASYDVNSHDDNPMPTYDMTDSNRHGTRCAGEVAATANNSICAVGIAYGASVGGVRMLDGDVTDAVEARSLSLNPQHIDIYSASWGPDDDGKTVDGPGEMASRAFIEGVTKGRNGKGSIFIWASGNGGRELDNCNCDGYTNSIWTLSISSATEEGNVPWYSEKCSSTLATTYSSGGQSEKQVVTTDLHHSCTVSHTGTSASAPLAAGIAALVLEANQNLTWRDLQHIVVRTAKPANLRDSTWSKNGVGRRISHSFGYGLMDAAGMVKAARTWKTVPEQQRCEINAPHVDKVIPPKGYITLQLTVKHCSSVNYLEHVQAKITLTSQRRGDIQLYLKSPAGTRVTLLTSRLHDASRSGFNQWPFMSVHTWGESPHGNWQLEIHNEGRFMAQITQWDLIFHGTEIPAQPDDAVHPTSSHFNPYGNDMDHNHLEFDPDAASGQWRNVEQVGESSLMTSDRSSGACLQVTIDQRCLACAYPAFIFDGHCYRTCPEQTFPSTLPELGIEESESNAIANAELPPNERGGEENPDLLSTDRKRSSIVFRGRRKTAEPAQRRRCIVCHKSCLSCYGPLNSHCSTCFPGSQLRKIQLFNESYCYVFAERSSGNSQDGSSLISSSDGIQKTINRDLIVFLIISVLVVIVISFVILIRSRSDLVTCRREGRQRNPVGDVAYSYDRVALLPDDDDNPDLAKEERGDVAAEEAKQNQSCDVAINCISETDSESESDVIYCTKHPPA